MAKVVIDAVNSFWDVSKTEEAILNQFFTVRDPKAFYVSSFKIGAWDGQVRFWKPVTKTLPSGLVDEAVAILEDSGHPVKVKNNAPRTLEPRPDAKINYEINADHQLTALEALCSSNRGILHAATNSGKTKIAQAWCALNDAKTLYLVPSRELLEQTYNSFKRDTNLKVGYVSAEKGWEIGEDVTICLVSSVAKRTSKRGKKIINEKVVKRFQNVALDFEAVFVDECHHLTGETWQWVLKQLKNTYYRYGLSGTPWENNNRLDELSVKSYLGPVLAKVSNKDLISVGWSAKPKITMIPVESSSVPESCVEYDEIYQAGIVLNDLRNSTIVKLCEKLASEGKSVLIISVLIAQCEVLGRLLSMCGVRHRVITGQTDPMNRETDLKDFKDGRYPVLISNILSEGVDIPTLNSLIFASGGKSSKKTLQRIGRGIRKKVGAENIVEIFDFIDEDHPILKRHTDYRQHLYSLENFEVSVLKTSLF